MNNMILYVIRHGKTKSNEQRLYCGKTNDVLSEAGIKEIKEKQNCYNYPVCAKNFTSGAIRANQTFELLYPQTFYEVRPLFWEYDFGEFEGKSYDMLKDDARYIEWIMDEEGAVSCPQGESKQDFYKRISKGLELLVDELLESHESEALLVCHGGVIGTLLHLFYDQRKHFYEYQPRCGGGYKLRLTKETSIKIEILEEF